MNKRLLLLLSPLCNVLPCSSYKNISYTTRRDEEVFSDFSITHSLRTKLANCANGCSRQYSTSVLVSLSSFVMELLLIICLFLVGGPADIPWFVIAVIIWVTIKRPIRRFLALWYRWFRADIAQELREVIYPLRAYRNPFFDAISFLVLAARLHVLPRLIFITFPSAMDRARYTVRPNKEKRFSFNPVFFFVTSASEFSFASTSTMTIAVGNF
jgi:hypothetical protein